MKPIRTEGTFLARMARRTLRIIAVAYGLILLALVLFEARLVYPGAFLPEASPADHSSVATVSYPTENGETTTGRLLDRPGAKNTLLYLHGNGTRSVWLNAKIQRLGEAFDAHVLAAEFRGFDNQDHTPTESSVIADAQAARTFLCDRYGLQPHQIMLYGRSLGGGVAAALVSDGGAQALILERTFDSLVAVAAGHYPWVPVSLLMRNRYDSIACLRSFQGPVIQLHGTTDRVVPIRHAIKLRESLSGSPKVWIQIVGLGHNARLSDDALRLIVEAVHRLTGLSQGS